MAKIWYNQILKGSRKYSDVPMEWKQQVKDLFIFSIGHGRITEQEYEMFVGEKYQTA